MTHGMKFDLIISNPPYTKNLDLKILKEVMPIGDRICFVHPVTWLLKNTENKHVPDYRNIKNLNERLSNVELFDGNSIFDILLFGQCCITYITEKSETINITDIENRTYSVNSIYDIDKYGWYHGYLNIKNKIFNYCKNSNLDTYRIHPNHTSENNRNFFIKKELKYDKKYIVGVPNIRGNVASDDFYTIVQIKNQNAHLGYNTVLNYTMFYFDNEKEQINFFNFLKLKFTRFCLSMVKNNQNLVSELASIPWFDFTKRWTDEECARELGITDKELLWMIQQIPNYYPEDEAKYKKLENKLK